ncbi:titin-like [Spodoptera litura]|uniref:Titin-like n=1 Tax=Spodoptera litura TaxID=69820 RepID=A0A9J7IY51_SPOLT|nr:titin-like [Spodoptera litura]
MIHSEGVTSYTATVLHAAKSLSKGLRGLGESVAHSLAGGRSTSQSPSPPNTDVQQPGVVTILDIEGNEEDDGQDNEETFDPIVAHFIAHSEAIIALKFDASGMLLVTADRRGHDFHVFRINPHPCGSSLASVHHLYILHRGDTTAKVQDIAISCDSRWAAISSLRGTTHVFAISPYGGAVGVRTHTQPRVVNRLSRFHRSAGLPIHGVPGKRATPVGDTMAQGAWFPNPRLPPYPLPTTLSPLAQLRPTANIPTHTITRNSSGRQRLSSLSEEPGAPLLARARAAPVAALYLMAANGSLLHLLLHPRPLSSIPKEKICDDSAIELEVEAVSQWPLQRPAAAADLLAPLPPSNPLLQPQTCRRCADMCMSEEERWLSQVEIVTHAGPHRRLWMGPQFVFKTYNCTGSSSSLSEAETVEVDTSAARGVARSNPVNMPGVRPVVPVLIDSGSASSLEHSPSDSFRRKSLLAETGRAASVCDVQLREDLAEAMKEDHGAASDCSPPAAPGPRPRCVARAVDPLGTVVQPPPASPPAAWPEPFAASNCDEATFRPVLRAPAPPEARPEDAARPLPLTTTIPVQTVTEPAPAPPPAPPRGLPTAVVIPAALQDDDIISFNLDKCSINEEAMREMRDARRSARSLAPAERACQAPPDTLPKQRQSGDIQPAAPPTVRRSPTPKSDTDVNSRDKKSSRIRESPRLRDEGSRAFRSSEVRERRGSTPKVERVAKMEPIQKESVPKEYVPKESVPKVTGSRESVPKEIVVKESVSKKIASRESVPKELPKDVIAKELVTKDPVMKEHPLRESDPIASVDTHEESSSASVTLKLSSKKKSESRSVREKDVEVIKTEEQAWDMLLNEPEKPIVPNKPPAEEKISEEPKPKSKKNRKGKKSQDDNQVKDEDTFVEIHTIEDKPQPSSGDLVSISTPYDDIEPVSFLAKAKKSRSTKSVTPERRHDFDPRAIWALDDSETSSLPKIENVDDVNDEWSEPISKNKSSDSEIGILITDSLKVEGTEQSASPLKESTQTKKTKSPSPYADRKSTDKRYETEVTDVYVIDTMKEDFPEIQITKASKTRKKSPQPEKVTQEDRPIKSWSSIAASKNDKITEERIEIEKKEKEERVLKAKDMNVEAESSDQVSLQDKLIELCKRPDIMVAQCDAPAELNFVEEHHSVRDLPPLEPLDFGLDDFKLEVMRDSLLEMNEGAVSSPICKINIDNILSTIKETTNKTIESSAFNLIDLEKVPSKKEKGFSVVENDKITSQEVKIDEDKSDDKDIGVMEKSSDDDVSSPLASLDSDKEDKKPTGASNVTMPSTKQSSKSKKSRKKKK